MEALNEINRELRLYIRIVGGESGSKWRTCGASFRWRYQEKDVLSLQRNLTNSQCVLDSAVQVVHL